MASIFQKLAYRRNKSKRQTGICPLSAIRKAVALLDYGDIDALKCINPMKDFFSRQNIELKVYVLCINGGRKVDGCVSVFPRNLDLIGCIRSKSKRIYRDADMFISLVSPNSWLTTYEASCSRARFKAGRQQTEDGVFDFVLSASEGKPLPDVFAAMADIFTKIK